MLRIELAEEYRVVRGKRRRSLWSVRRELGIVTLAVPGVALFFAGALDYVFLHDVSGGATNQSLLSSSEAGLQATGTMSSYPARDGNSSRAMSGGGRSRQGTNVDEFLSMSHVSEVVVSASYGVELCRVAMARSAT